MKKSEKNLFNKHKNEFVQWLRQKNNQNKAIGLNELELLFNDLCKMRWYKYIKLKIILINISFVLNRKERLLKQKIIFLVFFNQQYNFDYSLNIKNAEFDIIYNKKMTFFKYIKPY